MLAHEGAASVQTCRTLRTNLHIGNGGNQTSATATAKIAHTETYAFTLAHHQLFGALQLSWQVWHENTNAAKRLN